jgi:hypothetical protein
MSTQQLPGRPVHPSSPDQPRIESYVEPPLARPSRQERLLLASAAPNYIHNLPIPTYPSAVNPTHMLHQEAFQVEMKRTALAPFHAQAAGIVSRMYSSHFP